MITIYRKLEDGSIEQKFILENEEIPFGWTTDYDSLGVEEQLSDVELLKKENEALKSELAETKATLQKTDKEVLDMQLAVTDIYEMVLGGN
ncbi:hypothetical protein [Vagococcus xieshaowenii]|uniref:Uncharacterized protein n=1 Tax=Vagococcus xieshaowenii TaxID=2562451 RepID=A0AAJ5EG41_9ENTE|nr:hypothetical protein [Vagococcus xieshaowenii]QCA28266.1 hypothetical protein E4Z98_02650 [Vagococcus xieshaowenii]TFZ41921.1 hypothetical protein E4031_04830 [Vagococcus xieshaowenii]